MSHQRHTDLGKVSHGRLTRWIEGKEADDSRIFPITIVQDSLSRFPSPPEIA